MEMMGGSWPGVLLRGQTENRGCKKGVKGSGSYPAAAQDRTLIQIVLGAPSTPGDAITHLCLSRWGLCPSSWSGVEK